MSRDEAEFLQLGNKPLYISPVKPLQPRIFLGFFLLAVLVAVLIYYLTQVIYVNQYKNSIDLTKQTSIVSIVLVLSLLVLFAEK